MSEKADYASILSLKIDKFQTKLFLFDIVGEKYRLIATAESETTAFHPFNDIREGVFKAIDRIQNITGRIVIDSESNLIIPSQPDGSGIDCLSITFGFIDLISVVTMGLLESVSIESLDRLISMTQLKLLDRFSSADPRKVEEIFGLLINRLPNLIVVAGGTDQGASNAILKQIDMLRFIVRNVPEVNRPEILFVGNSQIQDEIVNRNKENLDISFAPNIRPKMELENLTPALKKIGQISIEYLNKKIGGFHDLANNCISTPVPISYAASFMTRFLSRLNNEPDTSVLYIEVNREGTFLVAAYDGKPAVELSNISLNSNTKVLLGEKPIKEITKWANIDSEDEEFKFYLWHKSVHTNIIPETEKQLEIEMSLARSIINNQVNKLFRNWPDLPRKTNQIIVSGEFFSNYTDPTDALFVLLNSTQPLGITKFYLDRHGIIPVLGSIATFNKFLPVQLIDSTAITLLAQVISINSNVKHGLPILTIDIEYDDGKQNVISVLKGSLVTIPLNPGQKAIAKITPLKKFDMGIAERNIGNDIVLQGGLCGAVIDARGRPVTLPKNESQRIETLQQWRSNMKI